MAYAPPWAFTSAWKYQVMKKPIAVNTSTSGRAAAAQRGAIPYRGR